MMLLFETFMWNKYIQLKNWKIFNNKIVKNNANDNETKDRTNRLFMLRCAQYAISWERQTHFEIIT